MPKIVAVDHLSLSVRNRRRSVDWYCGVLGFRIAEGGQDIRRRAFRRTRLIYGPEEKPDVVLAVTQHTKRPRDTFDELRTGLDHVALRVGSQEDLDEFERRLEEHGVAYTTVGSMGSGNRMIVLRDPDNIQLELYSRADGLS